MHKFYEIKSCKDKVAHLLTTYPECRDDDKMLLAYYQWYALGLEDKISKEDFYKRTKFAELPAHESITRARRKIQQENQGLRGDNWHIRHGEADYIRSNVSYL